MTTRRVRSSERLQLQLLQPSFSTCYSDPRTPYLSAHCFTHLFSNMTVVVAVCAAMQATHAVSHGLTARFLHVLVTQTQEPQVWAETRVDVVGAASIVVFAAAAVAVHHVWRCSFHTHLLRLHGPHLSVHFLTNFFITLP